MPTPGVIPVLGQTTSGNYGTVGSGSSLPVSYPGANLEGNIGLAWIVGKGSGTGITGLTSSNGNTWLPLPGISQGGGTGLYSQFWICARLKAGAETVTATGVTGSANGGPTLVLSEWQPPPCPPGSVGIQAFQGDGGIFAFDPALVFTSEWNENQGPFYHTLVVGLYNLSNGFSATVRTWTATPSTAALNGTPSDLIQGGEPTGDNTFDLSWSLVPYTISQNLVTYTYAPSTPVVQPHENTLIGVLFSSLE
jgi:hypothetical protein